MAVPAAADQEDLLVEAVTAAAVPTVGETAAMNVEAVQAVVMIASRKTVHH
jgi:hypothetical protein